MTTRNLDALFNPRSIALVGASNRPGSVGAVTARNLQESGFDGPIFPVNPHATAIRSTLAYPDVASLPQAPDLAVLVTPAETVPQIISDLGRRGCRAAVVITAGFDRTLRQSMLDAARPSLLRIVGPNCLGFLSPRRGVNASFAHLSPKPGGLALVAQSGAVAAAALDWAQARGVGFSHIVTIGDSADVDVGDLLDYLALDPETHGVLLYVESIADARKFMSAGRIAARSKPVVVIKAGRSAAGAKAAFSHTGALAGADIVYDAAFRRAGMLRVGDLRELFDAVSLLSSGVQLRGERLAILTNGGGAGVMAVDALEARGGRLAALAPSTIEAISAVAPATWSHTNPADIIGDATPERYAGALKAILSDPEADALLVMNCPTAVADSTAAAEAVIEAHRAQPGRPILTCWLGDTAVAEGRRRLAAAGLPAHETPDEAVRGFQQLVEHRRNQEMLMRVPTRDWATGDTARARAMVLGALSEGRDRLTDPEARELLRAYGVPVVDSRETPDAAAAARAAQEMAGPVALKILSRDISHKSDLGGVRLNLDPVQVEAEAQAMSARIAAAAPGAAQDGFIVQPMVSRPLAQELLAGITRDATFGPVILFGAGGVSVEVVADRAVGLPPLDDSLAQDMVSRTRVAALLKGYRDRPAADLDAVCGVLIRLGQIALDLPEVAELDINPLLADAGGVIALDARIRLSRDPVRSAIRPYPADLERAETLDGEPLTIRPVRPRDADRLSEMVALSSPEDVRLRFGVGMRRLPETWAARLSQIDYEREMALVAERPDGAILGVSRLSADPAGESGEFALMVRSDTQNRGLGWRLLSALLDHAVATGLKRVWGDVAASNHAMLDMAKSFGFEAAPAEDPARVVVTRRLGG